MQKGTRTDRAICEAIERLALDGFRPAEIHRRLPGLLGTNDVPTLRTVQNIARQVTPRDTSEDWGVATDASEDAAVLLPFLASITERTDGRIRRLTRNEAAMVARLLRAVPDLPAETAFRLARDYLGRMEHGQDAADLDAFLAFAPWRDEASAVRYYRAFQHGWIDHLHLEDAVVTAAVAADQQARREQHDDALKRAWAQVGTVPEA